MTIVETPFAEMVRAELEKLAEAPRVKNANEGHSLLLDEVGNFFLLTRLAREKADWDATLAALARCAAVAQKVAEDLDLIHRR